jgi:acetate kinase
MPAILCVNSGSSSLKTALYVASDGKARHLGGAEARGAVERIGPGAAAWLEAHGARRERREAGGDPAAALATAVELLDEAGVPKPTVVGHRVVHGGARWTAPTLVDERVLAGLRELVPLAPLHLPAAIAAIEAIAARRPDLPQVACFDTAFHATLPEVARRLPLPERFDHAGVRRYGFHGLSYEYVVSALGPAPPRRVVIAHLGNGASLAAVKDGRAVDTTMGFTPTGGVMMGTRTGDLDPGVLFYLAREQGFDLRALEELVEREGGLLGVGGVSDMQALLARAPTDPRAKLAVAMFGYSVKKAIGAFAAALGGLDLLVFTGGIGEHAAPVRAAACEGLDGIGIRLDPARNTRDADVVSADGSPCTIRVIPTNEDLVIARHALRVAARLTP